MFQSIIEEVSLMIQMYAEMDVAIAVEQYSVLARNMIIATCVLALMFFVFKGVAIYLMCKNKKIKNAGLAFVPFANFYLIGELTGNVRIFSWNIKKSGIWFAILMFSTFAIEFAWDYIIAFDEFKLLMTQNVLPSAIEYPNTLLNSIIYILTYILEIINFVFAVDVMFAFVAKYNRRHLLFYGIALAVCLIISPFYLLFNLGLGCVVMSSRNRPAFDVNEYLRQQQEILRAQQQNGGYNPNGYGQNGAFNPNTATKPTENQNVEDDPFAEFSDKKPSSNNDNLKQDVFHGFTPDSDMSSSDGKNFNSQNNGTTNTENKDNSNDKDDDLFN